MRCILVWTVGAVVTELPAARLDAALAALAPPPAAASTSETA
jgi:hypothetical protein